MPLNRINPAVKRWMLLIATVTVMETLVVAFTVFRLEWVQLPSSRKLYDFVFDFAGFLVLGFAFDQGADLIFLLMTLLDPDPEPENFPVAKQLRQWESGGNMARAARVGAVFFSLLPAAEYLMRGSWDSLIYLVYCLLCFLINRALWRELQRRVENQ